MAKAWTESRRGQCVTGSDPRSVVPPTCTPQTAATSSSSLVLAWLPLVQGSGLDVELREWSVQCVRLRRHLLRPSGSRSTCTAAKLHVNWTEQSLLPGTLNLCANRVTAELPKQPSRMIPSLGLTQPGLKQTPKLHAPRQYARRLRC